jgi:hypothetical protein
MWIQLELLCYSGVESFPVSEVELFRNLSVNPEARG